jgi:hypothetical protein
MKIGALFYFYKFVLLTSFVLRSRPELAECVR